jgi:non-heme chloroperoxidase
MDLRGHGQSEAPLEAECYTRGALWADDVAGVIRALELANPTLVGWSYGGLIIGDYLRIYGDADLAAVNLVCAAVGIGPSWFGPLIGPDFLEFAPLAASEDQPVALRAVHSLLHRMFVGQVSADDLELAVGWSMLTPAVVRGHMINRDEDFLPDFARLTKPLLVTFGAADTVVLPAMARTIQQNDPRCRVSEFAETGHVPFVEKAERFNRELAGLVDGTFDGA